MGKDDDKKKKLELEAAQNAVEMQNMAKVKLKSKSTDDDSAVILADFEKHFKRKPEKDGTLSFTSVEEAESFFEKHAKENRSFFGTWIKDGKPTDDHLFSCGTGRMYKGSFEKIQQELEASLETETDVTKKEQLEDGIAMIKSQKSTYEQQQLKEKVKAQQPAVDPSTAPTPASTAPSPFNK